MWHKWTNEERDTVLKMWKNGASASEIANEIGEGLTRSAILGYLFRLRKTMPELARLNRPHTVRQAGRKPKPKVSDTPIIQFNARTPIPEIPPPVDGIPYYETTRRHCKYILNTSKDPHNIKCCGHARFKESSWCEKHYHEVFIARIGHERRDDRLQTDKTQAA